VGLPLSFLSVKLLAKRARDYRPTIYDILYGLSWAGALNFLVAIALT